MKNAGLGNVGIEEAMDFRIADTFTDSLARLTGEEQKAALKKFYEIGE